MLGDLLSAGAKLIGGFMSSKQADKDREAQAAMAAQNIALQKEFAQNAIQWKAADAKAAGVHPYYAMGASTTSFNPVAVGHVGGGGMGDAIASMGQDLGRAVASTQTKDQRESSAVGQANALTLERGKLENELLKTRILSERSKLTAPQIGPAFPQADGNRFMIPGQGDTPLVKGQTHEPVRADPDNVHQEPGSITDVGFARTKDGLAPVPSKDVKERIEDNMIQEVMWAVRNQLLPTMGINKSPPKVPLPAGHYWEYDPWRQVYRIARGRNQRGPIWAEQ